MYLIAFSNHQKLFKAIISTSKALLCHLKLFKVIESSLVSSIAFKSFFKVEKLQNDRGIIIGFEYIILEIKPNIKNLDTNNVMQRIFDDHEHDLFFFFEP